MKIRGRLNGCGNAKAFAERTSLTKSSRYTDAQTPGCWKREGLRAGRGRIGIDRGVEERSFRARPEARGRADRDNRRARRENRGRADERRERRGRTVSRASARTRRPRFRRLRVVHRALQPVAVVTGAGLLDRSSALVHAQRHGRDDHRGRLAQEPRADDPADVLPQPAHCPVSLPRTQRRCESTVTRRLRESQGGRVRAATAAQARADKSC